MSERSSCSVPASAELLKPARLFFLPFEVSTTPPVDLVESYTNELNLRCYAGNSAQGDAYINLLSCRRGTDQPAERKEVTPTSVVNEPDQSPPQILRWVVDFSDPTVPSASQVAPTDDVIVEFEISRN